MNIYIFKPLSARNIVAARCCNPSAAIVSSIAFAGAPPPPPLLFKPGRRTSLLLAERCCTRGSWRWVIVPGWWNLSLHHSAAQTIKIGLRRHISIFEAFASCFLDRGKAMLGVAHGVFREIQLSTEKKIKMKYCSANLVR